MLDSRLWVATLIHKIGLTYARLLPLCYDPYIMDCSKLFFYFDIVILVFMIIFWGLEICINNIWHDNDHVRQYNNIISKYNIDNYLGVYITQLTS